MDPPLIWELEREVLQLERGLFLLPKGTQEQQLQESLILESAPSQ